jgi:hypothetical protein
MNYDDDDGHDTKGPLSLEGIFEIREFIDGNGNETGNEVVNLLEEMGEIEKRIGSLSSTTNDSDASLPENDKMKMFASSMKELSARVSREQQPKSDDEDVYKGIMRDVDKKGDNSTFDGSDPIEAFDRLDNLEKEEEEWQAESEATERMRQQERDLQIKTLPVASEGGWKKGFFKKTSQASSTKIKKEVAAESIVKNIESTIVPRGVKFAATPVCESDLNVGPSGDGLKKVEQPLPSSNKPSGNLDSKPIPSSLKKPPPISKAFTGNVMERFP